MADHHVGNPALLPQLDADAGDGLAAPDAGLEILHVVVGLLAGALGLRVADRAQRRSGLLSCDGGLFADRGELDVGPRLQIADQAPELAGQVLMDEEDA